MNASRRALPLPPDEKGIGFLYPTLLAGQVRQAAAEVARMRRRRSVEPADILLGLLAIPASLAYELLAAVSVSGEKLGEALGFSAATLSTVPGAGSAYVLESVETDSVLREAQRQARHRGYTAFGTDHLLLALATSTTPAGELLREMGATPERLTAEIERLEGVAEQHPGTGRPGDDAPPGPAPPGVCFALLVFLGHGLFWLLCSRSPWHSGGWTTWLPRLWALALSLALLPALMRAREWAWSCACLWLVIKGLLAVTAGTQAAILAADPADDSIAGLLAFLQLSQSAVCLGAGFSLFFQRGWFNARPRETWKTLLRQGGLVLAVTVAVELWPLIVRGAAQLSPGLGSAH